MRAFSFASKALLVIATIPLHPSCSSAFQATTILCRKKHKIDSLINCREANSQSRLSVIVENNAEDTEIDEGVIPAVTSVSLRNNHPTQRSKNFRMKVYATLNNPKIELLAAASVVLSTFLVAVGTLDNLSVEMYAAIENAVIGLNVLFTVDFFLRWYAAGNFKLIYLTKPLAIIDLFVVIIPTFIGSVMPMLDFFGLIGDVGESFATKADSGLQVLLLLRILRLRRDLTDIQTFRRFTSAMGIRQSDVRPYQLQLARVLLSIFTLLSVASGLIYTTEHLVNPAIPDYFTALYFGLTTLTTVGFGDITPVTFNGRLVVCGSILAGVAVIPAQAAKLVDAIIIASQEEGKVGNYLSGRVLSKSQPLMPERIIGTNRNNSTNGLGPSGVDLEVPPQEGMSTAISEISDSYSTFLEIPPNDVKSMEGSDNAPDPYKECENCGANGHRSDASFCFNCGSRI